MNTYTEQVRADAKKAADYIREHGWIQGRYFEKMPDEFGIFGSGACCVHGAIINATNADNCGTPLAVAFGKEIDGVPHEWNDAPGRTKEEVLAVFDRIANAPSL